MNIKALINKLNKYNLEIWISAGETVCIKSIKFFTGNQDTYDKNVLYIAKVSDIMSNLPIPTPINLMCIKDYPVIIEEIGVNGSNIMLICGSIELMEVFNTIQDILMEFWRFSGSSEKFLNAIAKEKGIQEIVDIGYEFLGNPILVTDLGHKVIAYTNVDVDNHPWNSIINAGYVPYNNVVNQEFKEFLEKAKIDSSPILLYTNNKDTILRNVITMGSKLLGVINVIEHFKKIENNDIEIVKLLSYSISMSLQKNKFICNSRGVASEYFLKDLFDGRIIHKETIEERIKFLDWNLKKNIYIIAIRSETLGTHAVSTIMKNLQEIVSGSRAVFYNQDILLVFSQDKEISQDEEKLFLFRKLLRKERMYAGISRCFKSLIEINEHYNQAVKTLEIGKIINSGENLFHYEDFAMYILFENCGDIEDLKSVCHRALLILSEYDKKNGTDFMQCLRNYLIYDKNPAKVASVMFVHRNTINYRINKIKEITNIDFDNYESTLHLSISFKIQEYLVAKKRAPEAPSFIN